MATSEKAMIKIETGQSPLAATAMTDSGDQTVFYLSGVKRFSGKSGYAPVIMPDGITVGFNVIKPDSAAVVNVVENLGFKVNLAGVSTTITAGDKATITRPATDVAKVNSICVDDTGDIVAVAGTDGASAAFSETRAAAGGPPLIPVGYVELAQVRVSLAADSVITDDQIYDSPGVHSERAMSPAYKEPNGVGDGIDAETTAKVDAYLEFDSALPKIHVGTIPKAVYIKVYTPILSEVSRVMDFVAAETAHSANSEEYYGGAIASVSKSLGQCSFSAFLNTGIVDPILRQKNQVVIVEYYQDRDQSAKIVQQGTLGIKRNFPVSGQIKADFTLTTTDYPSADFTE